MSSDRASGGETMIEVDSLSKAYGGSLAIDRVSFKIRRGEIVGLLGLNGAGKSTILKMLGCFLLPSAGTARVAGHAVEDAPHEIRKLIGYLPDTPPLYNEMTVASYLRFVARLKDVPATHVESAVRKAVERTNLQDVVRSRLEELSHGFRQRVGIAQALVHNPPVLILDEPINGLDPVQIVEMRDLIVSLRGEHTVILSSHILSEITRTCDRILIIDHGRLVAEGSEADLEHSVRAGVRLSCAVDQVDDQLLASLRSIPGVTKVSGWNGGGEGRLEVEAAKDVRAAVSKTIVGSGAALLGMAREEAGLEGVFMKLVKASGSEGRT